MKSARTWFFLAVLAIFLLALARGYAILFNSPLIGLANNFDMLRVQGCIRAYPVRADNVEPWAQSPQAPLLRYRFDKSIDPGCYFSTESWLARLYKPVLKKQSKLSGDGTFSIRSYGAFKLLLLVVSGLVISLLLLKNGLGFPSVVNAILFAVVFTDPGVVIFLNGFYAEFSAVLFAYLSVALVCVILFKKQGSKFEYALLLLCMVLVCLAKIQHFAFSLFLFSMVAVSTKFSELSKGTAIRLLSVMLFSAIIGAAIQLNHMSGMATGDMRKANITNTVLQGVLGSSKSPEATAALLGLPAHCAKHAGKTWFSPGVIENHPCPEVFDVSRLDIAALLLNDPTTIVSVFTGGIDRVRPWIPSYLGVVEGEYFGRLPDDIFTVDRFVSGLSRPAFGFLFLSPLVISLFFVAFRYSDSSGVTALLLFLSLYTQFSLVSVVFGDGFADVAKQFNLGMLSLLSFWIVFVLILAKAFAQALVSRFIKCNANIMIEP